MHRFFVEIEYSQILRVSGSTAHHILDVLRMLPGEELELVTDDGIVFRGVISALGDGWLEVASREILARPHEAAYKVTLGQGLSKGDKMDFVIQKAVELGAFRIIPLIMDNCVVKLEGDKAIRKHLRWEKIIQSAAQQSKRDYLPQLSPVCSFAQALQGDYDLIILAYEGETEQTLKQVLRNGSFENILVLIGPEGGVSERELNLAREAKARVVTLGRRILRTETAGLVVLSNIFYELG